MSVANAELPGDTVMSDTFFRGEEGEEKEAQAAAQGSSASGG